MASRTEFFKARCNFLFKEENQNTKPVDPKDKVQTEEDSSSSAPAAVVEGKAMSNAIWDTQKLRQRASTTQ